MTILIPNLELSFTFQLKCLKFYSRKNQDRHPRIYGA